VSPAPLDPAEVTAALADQGLRWVADGDALVTEWRGADFADAMAYVVRVAELAEEADHHPDIDIRYNRVRLRLWSHDAGGVTRRDLALAAAVDAVGGNAAPGDRPGRA
jgi:4a-hydroxytetrahydrobiopterin dehydratase